VQFILRGGKERSISENESIGASAMKGHPNDRASVAPHWWRREPTTAERVACLQGPEWIVDGVLCEAHALHENYDVPGRSSRSSPWPSRHVLVVDDDRDLRDLYTLALRVFGPYRVTTACDGGEGLARARALLPDAIVSDFAMPMVDGGQMAEWLAADERTRRIPIVMISGLGEEVPDRARRWCAAFLAKPCDPEELTRLVTLVVAARGNVV
jgi:CheY-like chemotaxis protein